MKASNQSGLTKDKKIQLATKNFCHEKWYIEMTGIFSRQNTMLARVIVRYLTRYILTNVSYYE